MSQNTFFEECMRTAASGVFLGSDCLELLDIGYKSRNLVKFHFKIKKNNLVHMPSLNLTLTLSFEPKFPMFNNNGYDRKSKRLKFLGSLSYFSLINFLQYAIP